jgi:hypothetical protein
MVVLYQLPKSAQHDCAQARVRLCEAISTLAFKADLTPGLGSVASDYLAK